jgi:hypothetical protein
MADVASKVPSYGEVPMDSSRASIAEGSPSAQAIVKLHFKAEDQFLSIPVENLDLTVKDLKNQHMNKEQRKKYELYSDGTPLGDDERVKDLISVDLVKVPAIVNIIALETSTPDG